MPVFEENFSKIVRSLLLDVDVHLDQLEQVGYLSKEQRAFLDKFLYKSEDALRAVAFTRASHGTDSLLTKFPGMESSPIRNTQSPSKSDIGASNAASRVLPRLRSVTEQLKSEENGLTTFLQRCNARNFSVKVRGNDIGKEPTIKVKGSEYILTLEPIAEGTAKSDINSVNPKANDHKSLDGVHPDTKMMLHGTDSHTRDLSVESIDYESTILKGAIARPSPGEAEQTINEAVKIKPTQVNSAYQKTIDFKTATEKTANTEQAPKPIEVELAHVNATNPQVSQIEPGKVDVAKIKLLDTKTDHEHTESHNSDQWGGCPSADTAQEVKTNAWGKPIKPDPTRNKEGAVVGGAARPLGADNKGRVIMEKMGWSKGTGLGKQMSGILEPIAHKVKNTKTGLRTADEKGREAVLSPASENTPTSTSDHTAEEKPVNMEASLESVVLNKAAWEQTIDNHNWEKAANLAAEPREQVTTKAITEKHEGEPRMAEAPNVKTKSEPIGIKAIYLNEGENPSLEKTIMLKSRIRATNENKTTVHSPGVRIRAITPQGSHYSKRTDDSSFKVWSGNILEILRAHQGDEYHVYSFTSRKRGIVKISLVDMMDEPKPMAADEKNWSTTPAIATNRA